jgi:tetratricopeptide (TPR) repeat protein
VEAEVKKFDDTKDSTHLTRARQYLQTAENLNPDSVGAHLAAGMLDEANGHYEKAREQYLRVKDIEPNNVEALIRIARMYGALEMPDKAVDTYRNAIKLDPTFYKSYEYLGTFYYFRGKYAEAAEQYRRVIARAPGMYRAYTNLAASLENLDRYAEAEQTVRSLLKLQETPDALVDMGTILACQKRDKEAVPYYERAVALNPQDYLSWLNLGDSNRRLGQVTRAKAEYRQGIRLALAQLREDPRNAYVRALVAYFSARLGSSDRAEDEIKEALSTGGNSRVILRAVITYEALGLRDEALATLGAAPPELIRDVAREPDLEDFSRDSRFQKLASRNIKGDQ